MGKEYHVKSVERALMILKCFQLDRKEISLNEFVSLTGLHKSTVYRLLMNLYKQGFVQMTDEGKYTPGMEIRRLGHLWDATEVLKRKAFPVLKYLSALTGETVFLIEYGHGRGICTDRIETDKALKITAQIGSSVPLFKGASGKSIAAFLKAREKEMSYRIQKEIYQEEYDINQIENALAIIADQGYAWTTSEVDEEVTAFAVPLLGEDGEVKGSISIAGPAFRFTWDVLNHYRSEVMSIVEEVTW